MQRGARVALSGRRCSSLEAMWVMHAHAHAHREDHARRGDVSCPRAAGSQTSLLRRGVPWGRAWVFTSQVVPWTSLLPQTPGEPLLPPGRRETPLPAPLPWAPSLLVPMRWWSPREPRPCVLPWREFPFRLVLNFLKGNKRRCPCLRALDVSSDSLRFQ